MTGPAIVGLGARLSKLRAMSVSEVVSRVWYRVVVDLERRQHRRNRNASPDRLRRSLRSPSHGADWSERLLESRRTMSARFLPGAHERPRMRDIFDATLHRERQQTLKDAARARDHRFEFFGLEFRYGAEINWQEDPVTRQRWPSSYHADVPVHGGDAGFGDVKYVWELNRQQYLIDLAKSWFLSDNPDDLQAVRRLVRSWIVGNPYATGVNWSCALEPAFRTWSWLWAYHLTVDALDDEFHLEWLQAFYDHGRFLARHLELYSSPYNHLIGEAAALYALGLCFQELRESDAWRRKGRAILEGRLREQFYVDGGSVEQSAFYHHATVGFYLLAALVGRANGDALSPAVWKAIERALEFSLLLTQPNGRIPEIGGADDGKPIRLEHLPFWDFRPYLAIGAVLFERPDFKAVAGRFFEDALWLLGPAGLDSFNALESRPPSETAVVLDASGYAIDRTDWSDQADYVCFDVGEQAAGMRPDAVPNSMHGHADCLSVIVWLGGRRVLVDSGLFAYNCGGLWEAHFRETAAHNTARVDGRDQARHIGKMAWSHSYRAKVEGRMADGRQSWAIGSHDGYARGVDGVTHRRAVWRRPEGYLLICDEFVGHGEHEIEVNFQFAPGTLNMPDANRAIFDGFAEMVWVGNGTWLAETRCGGPDPEDGWICPSLGERQPAPRLTLTSSTIGHRTSLLTVLADRRRFPRRASLLRSGTAGTLVAVAGDAHIDWVAAAGIAHGSAINTDALLAVCRVGADGEVERISTGGAHLLVDSDALVRLVPLVYPVGVR
jgi:hypothetical protein